ncbi:MAG TPA: class I SAM-dependent methyltransferase [Vicinamibacterales bacterium]|nr:class I SAM-dependent methyltransferase [Vicinamibacterales bacterium]
MTAATHWGRKAAALYQSAYARQYRAHDDELGRGHVYARFCRWLGGICDGFERDIDVLELGCGTGRYFRAIRHARTLVGIDASAAMLAEARAPLAADEITTGSIDLIEADIVTCDLGLSRFDFVYAIGVLAEHTPLDAGIVDKVARCLRTGGRFAFTTVHPDSASVPRTFRRRAGRLLLPLTWGSVRRILRTRLNAHGLYADDTLIRELLRGRFAIESLEHMESEAHLHCLCTARKADG